MYTDKHSSRQMAFKGVFKQKYNDDNDNTLFKRRKMKKKIVKVSLERGYSRG